jgi:hypothetical protein
MGKGSIVLAGCAKNSAPFLPGALRNLERIGSLFSESACVVLENDSADQTKQLLSAWGRGRKNFEMVSFDGLAKMEPRTLRLEFVRNTLVEIVRSWDMVRDFDYVFLADLDDVNARELDLGQFSEALDWMAGRPDVAAIFPNQIGPYYDMWALRHETICPADVCEEVYDYQVSHDCDDETAYQATFARRIFTLPVTNAPLQVDSAFGGFGIYRLGYYLRNQNPYWGHKVKIIRKARQCTIRRFQQCEHVHFHAGIRQLGGKLFVMPGLINRQTTGIQFSHSWHRSLVF